MKRGLRKTAVSIFDAERLCIALATAVFTPLRAVTPRDASDESPEPDAAIQAGSGVIAVTEGRPGPT
jgi:hypothetical protein